MHGGGSKLPPSQALMAEVTRLRGQLVAARRGAALSEKVESAMAEVRSCWRDSESRLVLLQGEQQSALVAHRTLLADVRQLEIMCAGLAADLQNAEQVWAVVNDDLTSHV